MKRGYTQLNDIVFRFSNFVFIQITQHLHWLCNFVFAK